MKTMTIRLPDTMVERIEQESRARRVSKSAIVRERLAALPPARQDHPRLRGAFAAAPERGDAEP